MTPAITPREVVDAVREDSRLNPGEKETTFRFSKIEDVVEVFTDEAGLLRRLLVHPESEVDFLNVLDGDERHTIEDVRDYSGGDVVSGALEVPVGVLQVKLNPRSDRAHSSIVTDRVLGYREGEDEEVAVNE